MPDQTEEASQKTEVPPEILQDGQDRTVLRLAEFKLHMVEYTEGGYPGTRTRMVAVSEQTNQVFFLEDKTFGRPAQAWFSNAILSKLRATKG